MSKHLEILEGYISACSAPLQERILETIGRIVLNFNFSAADLVSSENDDLLAGLQKDEKFFKAMRSSRQEQFRLLESVPGYVMPTWENVKAAIVRLGKDQISEPFLVTSLLLAVDDMLQVGADENWMMQAGGALQKMTEAVERQHSTDSPENATENGFMVRYFHDIVNETEMRLAVNKAHLEEWRKIIGDRWKQRRLMGTWGDVMVQEQRD